MPAENPPVRFDRDQLDAAGLLPAARSRPDQGNVTHHGVADDRQAARSAPERISPQ